MILTLNEDDHVFNENVTESNGPKVSNKSSITNWATQEDVGDTILAAEDFLYRIKFTLPKDFGEPGAFFVRNNHRNEFFLVSLTLELPDKRTIAFPCNSWIYSTSNYTNDRVFFSNKVSRLFDPTYVIITVI